ncbi:MAG: redoxin domain-containing protein [Prevotella sp.]|nr:redoxin domain-containing protein [Prevotella sp.]
MKKIVLSMAMLAVAMIGYANDGNLHVKGNLKNVGDTLMVLTRSTMNTPKTVIVNDGKFEFDFPLTEVTDIIVVSPDLMRGQRGANSVQMQLIGVPGETMELVGDVKDRYDINGSKFYKEYHEVDMMLENAQKEANEFQKKLMERMQKGESQDQIMKEYQEGMPALQEKANKAIIDFVKAHPNYEASATLVPQFAQDGLDKMKEVAALLGDNVKNGRMKAYYQNIIDQVEAQAKAEAESAKKQAAGVVAPDFTLNDINGKPLSLSSLRGKYVILDFWGSWCGWCIKGFPEMKKYYEKYKGKFEILGIDCNDTEQKWKDAVKKNELPWLHVYNTRDSKVLADYGVNGFPTKIIVGPDGKIVKTIVGEDPAFYTLLDSLFQ